MQEQLELEKLKKEPNISAYLDNGGSIRSVLLVLSNDGEGVAKEVKAKISPSFDLGNEGLKKYFERNALFNKGVTIVPFVKRQIRFAWITPELKSSCKDGTLNAQYELELEYKNINGKLFKSTFTLAVDEFFNTLDPLDKTDFTKIAESLETIAKFIESINDTQALNK